jgi:hypothetical protein
MNTISKLQEVSALSREKSGAWALWVILHRRRTWFCCWVPWSGSSTIDPAVGVDKRIVYRNNPSPANLLEAQKKGTNPLAWFVPLNLPEGGVLPVGINS